MKNNNAEDFALNVWLTISIVPPILSYAYNFIFHGIHHGLKSIPVLIFIILFSMMVALPFLFLIQKISKSLFQKKYPVWLVRLILIGVTFLGIILVHLLFYHKSLRFSSTHLGKFYWEIFLYHFFSLIRFYLLVAGLSIGFFKIKKKEVKPKVKSSPNILDDEFL